MAHYRKIDVRIWNDAKFKRLTNDGKLAFFALLSHPDLFSTGALRGTFLALAAETGIPHAGFEEIAAAGMAQADPESPLIWLPNFLKYNPPANPSVVCAWWKSLDRLPECKLRSVFTDAIVRFLEAFPEAYREAFRAPSGTLSAPPCGTPSGTSGSKEHRSENSEKRLRTETGEGGAEGSSPSLPREIPEIGLSPKRLATTWNELVATPTRLPSVRLDPIASEYEERARSEIRAAPDLAYWKQVMAKIVLSGRCVKGENRWAGANFMFMLRHHARILAGEWDDRASSNGGARNPFGIPPIPDWQPRKSL